MKLAIFAFPDLPVEEYPRFMVCLGDAEDTRYSGSSVQELAQMLAGYRATYHTIDGYAALVVDISSMTVTPGDIRVAVVSSSTAETSYAATIVDNLPQPGLTLKTEGVNLGVLLAGTAIGALFAQ